MCGILATNETPLHEKDFQSMTTQLYGNVPTECVRGEGYALACAGYNSTSKEGSCTKQTDHHVICFEGRIDNRETLIGDLGLHANASYADIIDAAYSRWGKELVNKFVGAFTVAVIDRQQKDLFIANDHLGLRPLYYSEIGSARIVFGSNVRQILAALPAAPTINRRKLLEILSPFFVDDEGRFDPTLTMFEGVYATTNATMLHLNQSNGSLQQKQYWRAPERLRKDWISPAECAAEFRRLFYEVIAAHLDTPYPIGMELSGGIDSGCNACIASDILRTSGRASHPMHTYTLTFDSQNPRERQKIQDIHRMWTQLKGHFVRGDNKCGYIESSPSPEYRTVGDVCGMNLPEAYLAMTQAAMRDGCRLLISGEGADWYLEGTDLVWDSLIKQGKWAEFRKAIEVLRTRASTRKILQYLFRFGVKPLLPFGLSQRAYMQEYYAAICEGKVPDLFTEKLSSELREYMDLQRRGLARRNPLECWNQQLEHELIFPPNHNWQGIPFDLEIRFPYLDKRLVEYGLAVPPEYKFVFAQDRHSHYGARKYLQRAVCRHVMPTSVIESQHKETYSAPADKRLIEYLPRVFKKAETIHIVDLGIVDMNKFQSTVDALLADPASFSDGPESSWLDMLLNLELWLRATAREFGYRSS